MKKVNELNIKINKAIITDIQVELKEENVVWTVRGKLITEQGMAISDFYFSNDSWMNKDKKISVPLEANSLGRKLFEAFTPEVLEKLGNMFTALPAPKEENNIDNIPF